MSNESKVEAMGHGSTGQTELSRADLAVMSVIVPSLNTQKTIEPFLVGWGNKVTENFNNMKSLTKLRDTLLPKLISGELRIPEAEKLTKKALA